MIDGKFNVVFRGQIVKSQELSQVKQNLVKLFKSNEQAIERLFGGQEVVIRKDLDYAAAMKYQSALKNAGALALIQEVDGAAAEQPTASPSPSNESPVNKPVSAATESNAEQVTATVSESSYEPASSPSAESDNLSMAEVGAQILPPKVYEKREVDTSELSLAAAGERILPEKEPEHHAQPSIDHLKLAD